MRSTATKWVKNSVLAFDAGTHLAGIVKIMEKHHPLSSSPTETIPNGVASEPSPFHGLDLPSDHPRGNASHVLTELVSTYLLSHSHLDHISGLVINSAAFMDTKNPKKLAALPKVISAIKSHIFNDIIWPNLSDEDAGVGLLSYQRLPLSQEYVPVSVGLSVQTWPVSHGHCMKSHTHWGRKSTAGLINTDCDGAHSSHNHQQRWCVLDSAVFFIREEATGKEVMMWGDVEPGSSPPHPPKGSSDVLQTRSRLTLEICVCGGRRRGSSMPTHSPQYSSSAATKSPTPTRTSTATSPPTT